jgi:hypothetical protein
MSKVEVTKADERALAQALRRRGDAGATVDELRTILVTRIRRRSPGDPWSSWLEAWPTAVQAVPRLLAKWKREGKAINPVRGRWRWVS